MIRVFPRRTKWTPDDALAFVGRPDLFRPPIQPVRVSVAFTWDIAEGMRLFKCWSDMYPDVKIGGPAFGDPGGEFVPGRFIKPGVTITSRGCIRACGHCFVPSREGMTIRELAIQDGHIIQDNNILACSRPHIEAVFDMLRRQRKGAIFSGGLDVRLLQSWHRDLMDSIRVADLWFACDSPAVMPHLERAAGILDGIPLDKKRCYVMIGFNGEPLADAEARLRKVFNLGFLPFAILYQGPERIEYSQEWKALAKAWSRPAIYKRKERQQ